MCMLCVAPPNVTPSREKLINSALNNPHGFGFAVLIPSENRVHVEHTMNADTSINRFLEMRGKYPESYAMWHARLATHGSKTIHNCHPFKVGNDNLTYLGHNGVLPVIECKDDIRSDTHLFASKLLPSIGGVVSLDNIQVMNMVKKFTQGSKICVLTLNPRAKKQCYIIHEDSGLRDSSGVWWSNNGYVLAPYSYYDTYSKYSYLGTSNAHDSDLMDYIECDLCKAVTTIPDGQEWLKYCPHCYNCYLCYAPHLDCLCYFKGSKYTYDERSYFK